MSRCPVCGDPWCREEAGTVGPTCHPGGVLRQRITLDGMEAVTATATRDLATDQARVLVYVGPGLVLDLDAALADALADALIDALALNPIELT